MAHRDQVNAGRRKWRAAHRDQVNAQKRKWDAAHRDQENARKKNYELRKKYGLTPEEQRERYEEQGCRCPLCPSGTPATGLSNLQQDHDHKSGKARSLLCARHNVLLTQLFEFYVRSSALSSELPDSEAARECQRIWDYLNYWWKRNENN